MLKKKKAIHSYEHVGFSIGKGHYPYQLAFSDVVKLNKIVNKETRKATIF